ncbi:MAG: hypothetical protein KatS3mg057_2886 [Herpetosiphonaceae bacterium]|nr:MAG: hypothetical protein KatS3mg057_2886 [Herpetosiphonaceae bacterium]
MSIEVKLFFEENSGTDLVIRASRTVQDFITSYLSNHTTASVDPGAYRLFCSIDGGRTFRELAPQQTFESLGIPHGAWLVLRAGSIPNLSTALQRHSPASESGNAPEQAAPHPPRTRFNCHLEISSGKRIPVSRHGLIINRQFVQSQLPIQKRVIYTLRSSLLYIGRAVHCEIYFDDLAQQWILKADRPVYIDGCLYDKGMLYHLQPPKTQARLGREGIELTIHLTSSAPSSE